MRLIVTQPQAVEVAGHTQIDRFGIHEKVQPGFPR
jgi:hypothetical protein